MSVYTRQDLTVMQGWSLESKVLEYIGVPYGRTGGEEDVAGPGISGQRKEAP